MDITFVVEDGTGLATATSYVSVEDMKQAWYNVNYSYDTLTDNDIKRLLNRSTGFIDNEYRNSFPGYRDTDTQSLEWGRNSAYYLDGFEIPDGSIPPEIKSAVNELAYQFNIGNVPEDIIDKNGKIIAESSQVDVIKESIKYEEGSSFYEDIYASVDRILSRITGGTSDRFILSVIRTGGDSA